MRAASIIEVLGQVKVLNQYEHLASAAGWIKVPGVNIDVGVNQLERLSNVAEAAGHRDPKSAAAAAVPMNESDVSLFTRLSNAAADEGEQWYLVHRDIATIMILAHSDGIDCKSFYPPFKSSLMRAMCKVLELDWPILDSDGESNG